MSSNPLRGDAAQPLPDSDRTWSRRDLLKSSAMIGLGVGLGVGLLPSLGKAAERGASMPVRRRMVNAIDGRFHVLEQGEGPAVLFCHGFPDTAEIWRSQMQAVAEAGYRAVAIDMRGYGHSYAPADPDLYTSLHIVGDLVGVLDALSINTAVIVGHDWGADHAQRAALMRPDRFRALVSLSIPFTPRGEIDQWRALREQGLGDTYYAFNLMQQGAEARFAEAARSIPSVLYWLSASPDPAQRWDPTNPDRDMLRPAPVDLPSWADPAYVRHSVETFQRTGFRGGLNYYRALPRTFELMPAYKDAVIRQPSLYIWGAADGLCQLFHPKTPSIADLRKAQPNLVGQVRLENVGHWVQHEAASSMNEALTSFLATL